LSTDTGTTNPLSYPSTSDLDTSGFTFDMVGGGAGGGGVGSGGGGGGGSVGADFDFGSLMGLGEAGGFDFAQYLADQEGEGGEEGMGV
jgi:hypothetical protein